MNSAGKKYEEAVRNKWRIEEKIPIGVKKIKVLAVEEDMLEICEKVDLVFCALDMDKEKIKALEIAYAERGIPVISNNSAHRLTEDIPMIIPEINYDHIKLIDIQRKTRGWKKGLIAVKPNCSIQSYVAILTPLLSYEPQKVLVTSFQSISGAGKNFEMWPEMIDNVIPYIEGEEEKSENEPMRIWGKIKNNKIEKLKKPIISSICLRAPVTNGHMAVVSVKFGKKLDKNKIINLVEKYNPLKSLNLPSCPDKFIKYFDDVSRPQLKIDRNFEKGMGITMGRLEKDKIMDWRFVSLSHNTVRGAAGGAILLAELLVKKGYIN